MLHSLRFSMLLAMFAVAAVTIITITLFAGVTTRIGFSRYVQAGRQIREEQMQQIMLSFWQDNSETTSSNARRPAGTFFSDGNGLYFDSRSMRIFPIRLQDGNDFVITNDSSVKSVRLVSAPDGSTEIISDGRSIGSYTAEPMDELQLIPAQIDFMQSVNYGLLLAMGVAGLSAVVLTFILSRRIVQPVAQLTQAARMLESGDLDQRVRTSARGEIGELAHAFNAMAESLNKNETLRRNMVSDVAHELRTPLTNIRGYLEAIQDGVVDADTETIDMIYEEAINLNNIIQDLQELALAEAGQLRYSRDRVEVEDVIAQTVSMLKPSAQAKQIQLQIDLPYKLPAVYADEHRVSQIMRNLVSNAVKFTPDRGTITVSGASRMTDVEIRVNDTGHGISSEHIPLLFERFYRAEPSRNRATGGAGLGLAITRQLVEAMGGRIMVESEVGYGTTFSFTLPKYTAAHEEVHINPEHQALHRTALEIG